jgi:hypothetical protein
VWLGSPNEVISMTSVITRHVPPQRLIGLVNPVVRLALRSPLHPVLDRALLTLHVTGRVTGRHYDIPVGYVDVDGRLIVVTQHRWRVNLRGGCEVEVTHAGRRAPMHADLDEQAASVAATLHAVIDRIGPKAARSQLGLTIAGDETPSVGEVEEAVREYDLATLTLSRPHEQDVDMPDT